MLFRDEKFIYVYAQLSNGVKMNKKILITVLISFLAIISCFYISGNYGTNAIPLNLNDLSLTSTIPGDSNTSQQTNNTEQTKATNPESTDNEKQSSSQPQTTSESASQTETPPQPKLETCWACEGKGYVILTDQACIDALGTNKYHCYACDGTGLWDPNA